MKFKLKDKSNEYKHGRIIKRFALFPIKIGLEIRWFETCYIRQRYWSSWHETGWEDLDFATVDDYENWLITGKLY